MEGSSKNPSSRSSPAGRRATVPTANCSATRNNKTPWLEQITYLPIVLRIRGRSHNREGVFHEFAFLVCSHNLLFLLPGRRTAQRSPLRRVRRLKSNEIRPPQHFSDPSFSAREVLISSSLPPSNGTRVVSSHIHADICK